MKTIKINAPAKINLALNITGIKDGYHMLDSVVSTVDLFDVINMSTRNDGKITLKMTGVPLDFMLAPEENNAYKAAKIYMDEFCSTGVDITIKKNIPIGGGLGGSSADVAGVLRGMKALYGCGNPSEIKSIADGIGSDCGYLLTGGYARLKGRGEIITPIQSDKVLYVVGIALENGVNTAECFKEFDKEKTSDTLGDIEGLINQLENGWDYYLNGTYNALYQPAIKLNPEISFALEEIKNLSPSCAVMSGSGSTVYGVFPTDELSKWAKNKLLKKYDNVFTCKTADLKTVDKFIK